MDEASFLAVLPKGLLGAAVRDTEPRGYGIKNNRPIQLPKVQSGENVSVGMVARI